MMKTKILCSSLILAFSLCALTSCKEEHTHQFSTEYSGDETHHWYQCDCKEIAEKEEHLWDEGRILIYPTTESEGIESFKCTECGYEKREAVARLEQTHSHSFDSGKVNSDGLIEYTCSCGFKKTEPPVGNYAVTTLKAVEGDIIKLIYTDISAGGLVEVVLPEIDGYVPEYDRFIIDVENNSSENTIYYSPLSIWDGISVSERLSGEGTEESPYLIQSAADFAYLGAGDFAGKHFKLTVSVDLADNAFHVDSFNGIIDGNHCSIRGISNSKGLFGTLGENSVACNLSLYGDVLAAQNIGVLAATSYGKLSGIVNYVSLVGNGRLGGIVYSSSGIFENCKNYGDIKGQWDIGGIVGYIAPEYQSTVSGCVNYGNISGTTGVGGIFGFADPSASIIVTDSVNYGNITATWGGGGIGGNISRESVVSGCESYGSVIGDGELGGIVGKCSGKLTDNTNYGRVSGEVDIIGGVIGHLHDTTYGREIVETNKNLGEVSGPNACDLVGDGYVYTEEESGASGPLTEEEFKAQPAMYGSPWMNAKTRMKIVVKIKMAKGTVITFLGDTSVYCWGVMETTDKDNASSGAWKDSGWNTSWDDPTAKTYTTTYAAGYLVLTVGRLDSSGKPNVELTEDELNNIHSMFKVEGEKAGSDGSGSNNNVWLDEDMVSINHRGWHKAPENTLSAYEESYNQGFKYVECDVQFTKDGIPVLLHDDTIDRTSNGSGTLSQMTYAELLQYDFSYDHNDTVNDFSAYRGEKIPTFEEFIALCKRLGLHPYIEIKGNITDAEAKLLLKIVSDADMLRGVSWLSFSGDALARIADNCPGARLVWVLTDTNAAKIRANNIPFAKANLMTGESEVVFDLYYTLAKKDVCDLLRTEGIPLEVWTVNSIDAILSLDPYVSGVSSDSLNAKEIIEDSK